jgi:hypothetical protein
MNERHDHASSRKTEASNSLSQPVHDDIVGKNLETAALSGLNSWMVILGKPLSVKC